MHGTPRVLADLNSGNLDLIEAFDHDGDGRQIESYHSGGGYGRHVIDDILSGTGSGLPDDLMVT